VTARTFRDLDFTVHQGRAVVLIRDPNGPPYEVHLTTTEIDQLRARLDLLEMGLSVEATQARPATAEIEF
jgi:hypothetical protein